MNSKKLAKLGVPSDCFTAALTGITTSAREGVLKSLDVETLIPQIVADPDAYKEHQYFGALALDLIESRKVPVSRDPIPYKIWGRDGIDPNAIEQMNKACTVPTAVGAALMPDAHLGYGLPIGGVLALDNAVCPYAVGVDIACRMKMTVLDYPDLALDGPKFEALREAIEKGTRFGVGGEYGRSGRQQHDVMDDPRWESIPMLAALKDTAWSQLGTSGSGNHFAEFGSLSVPAKNELGLEAGTYVALLSHSGSRGTGARVCDHYSRVAKESLSRRLQEQYPRLEWLSLDSAEGQEYWIAMNLMGDYAAANHDVLHRNVSRLLGAKIIAGVENHHNFAWKEIHNGKEVVVHRKGATPAGVGVLGVIPGSMATPAFVVRGKGSTESLHSASHGAGRVMSRKAAKDMYNFNAVKKDLEKTKGVRILSAGPDEVPYVYKPIEEVMEAQQDLVEVVARFDPKIIKMSGDGRAED